LATLTDVPVLETLVAGVTLWWAGIWRGSTDPVTGPPGAQQVEFSD
jgi:hypothetical protein